MLNIQYIDLEVKMLKYIFTRVKISETRNSYDVCWLSEWAVRISIRNRTGVASSHLIDMVWLYRSPIPEGVFYLPKVVTTCLPASIREGCRPACSLNMKKIVRVLLLKKP